MKYFEKGVTENGYGKDGIILAKRVFSITKDDDGKFNFMEECDGYFDIKLTKEESIEMLKEAISWIQRT